MPGAWAKVKFIDFNNIIDMARMFLQATSSESKIVMVPTLALQLKKYPYLLVGYKLALGHIRSQKASGGGITSLWVVSCVYVWNDTKYSPIW